MSYSISYRDNTARVDYTGANTVEEILQAHTDLAESEEFYECRNLVLDVSKCDLSGVSVADLFEVVASDLWTSRKIKSLKVAFLVQSFVNMEKTSEFINESKVSPWEWRLFESEDRALAWFDG